MKSFEEIISSPHLWGEAAFCGGHVAFAKSAEFAEKYLRKGMKIAISGRIQTGSYTNRDGAKVYTTDIVVEEHDFCESRSANENARNGMPERMPDNSGFVNIPDDIDEDLPFN